MILTVRHSVDSGTGELLITKCDADSKIISETFSFDAVNANGAKVEIREGRFDLKY